VTPTSDLRLNKSSFGEIELKVNLYWGAALKPTYEMNLFLSNRYSCLKNQKLMIFQQMKTIARVWKNWLTLLEKDVMKKIYSLKLTTTRRSCVNQITGSLQSRPYSTESLESRYPLSCYQVWQLSSLNHVDKKSFNKAQMLSVPTFVYLQEKNSIKNLKTMFKAVGFHFRSL